jgi:hypothetical protein
MLLSSSGSDRTKTIFRVPLDVGGTLVYVVGVDPPPLAAVSEVWDRGCF